MAREREPDDPRVDTAAHIAQAMAETLGAHADVDMAVVIIVKARDVKERRIRVGAFAPNRGAIRDILSDLLANMDGDEAVHVDVREYKPEVDGE